VTKSRLQLRQPREEARKALTARITIGRQLLLSPIGSPADVELTERVVRQWGDANQNLLRLLFDTADAADQYAERRPRLTIGRPIPHDDRVANIAKTLVFEVAAIEAQLESLGLLHEVESDAEEVRASVESVFVVHGHDDAAVHQVARFLSSGGLKPRILRELPNAGKTIIEKFENYATTAYAIVLLTPDDSCSNDSGHVEKRARQNVILELGYFIGRLGRERVCALYKDGTEIPSDYDGVLFVPFDDKGGWQWTLARELKAAHLNFDTDRALT
jgi:predicted nucleotide-binding protein